MREIEVKAWVRDETTLMKNLKGKGIVLGDKIRQRDVVYGLPEAYAGAHFVWLRIRTENNRKYIFTLKRTVTQGLDSIEHETVVEDAKELTAIIKELGYVPFSDITKTRQKTKIGEIEICFDKVDGLGVFIEAEKMCEHEVDIKNVRLELWQLLESLGVSPIDEESKGYDLLINNNKN